MPNQRQDLCELVLDIARTCESLAEDRAEKEELLAWVQSQLAYHALRAQYGQLTYPEAKVSR